LLGASGNALHIITSAYLDKGFERLIVDPHIPHRIKQGRTVRHSSLDLSYSLESGILLPLGSQILWQIYAELTDRLYAG